ncbi:MAG TPA: 3',5'-cyclic-AMP phosphodiesterase [Candidatus Tenderia sp.]|nr:3',5'-cyclic-AMP phosphodiesterase [Candidatus Tenderia sp.]
MDSSIPPLNIAQISDSHLYADLDSGLYGLNSHHALREVVALAAQRQPELLLLTGDLVHDETATGYRHLRRAVAPLNAPGLCIPGNHDDLKLMREVFAEEAGLRCDKSIRLGNWQIILLNSQVAGKVSGYLAQEELDFLELSLTKYPRHHALVCMHHQPVAVGSQWLDQIGLANADQLFAVVDRHPQVKALVWGHVHQAFDEQRNGVRLLATPATCIQFKPKADEFALDLKTPGYRWFRLHQNGHLDSAVERLQTMPGVLDVDAPGYAEDT